MLAAPNASRIVRFTHDPPVTREPDARFHAGAALRLGGWRIGVLDDQLRRLFPTSQEECPFQQARGAAALPGVRLLKPG